MQFIVYAPGPFGCYGGGSIALHKLCHNINLLGEKCDIVTDSKAPGYLGEMQTVEQAKERCRYGKTMVIYPEVTEGNPLESQDVTRWILFFEKHVGQRGIYGPNDLIYKYAPIFTLRNERPVDGELRAFELHLDLFYETELYPESYYDTCYLKKKSDNKTFIHSADAICLDNVPKDESYLINIARHFRACDKFYSYDTATFLSPLAALCGCQSIVIPDPNITAEEWRNGFPYFKYGIAYGTDAKELEYAKETAGMVRSNLKALESQSLIQTQLFIDKAKTIIG